MIFYTDIELMSLVSCATVVAGLCFGIIVFVVAHVLF
jgi:hypothetical protein